MLEHKYLTRQSEPEAALTLPEQRFERVLVIPCCGEGKNILPTLASIESLSRPALVIVVINEAEGASDERRTQNQESVTALEQNFSAGPTLASKPLIRLFYSGKMTVLCVERTGTEALPPKEGVGLARKIGCDLALALIARGTVSAPWIFCTDADAVLPLDYFEAVDAALKNSDKAAALVYPFWHAAEPDPETHRAAQLYELSLRYYTLGLAWADSPYGYQSMGSCMVIHAKAYADTHGFPKLLAAEDFYLLCKLAKQGQVLRPVGKPIILSGRISDRVPFGTGNSVAYFRDRLDQFSLYHPRIFHCLKVVLSAFPSLAQEDCGLGALLQSELDATAADAVNQVMDSLGFAAATQKIKANSKGPAMTLRQMHIWFDAFRTLKFVHALRDILAANVPWWQALQQAPFIDVGGVISDDLDDLRQSLAKSEAYYEARGLKND